MILSAFSLFFCWLRPSWQRTITTSRNVQNLHGGVRGVHALATGTAGATDFNPQILRFQFEIDFLRLGQDGHGRGGCVDATLRLSRRDALHAMDATFKTKLPKNAFARNLENRFF